MGTARSPRTRLSLAGCLLAGYLLAITTGCAPGGPNPALGPTPADLPSAQVQRVGVRLNAVAERIMRDREPADIPGFTSIALNYDQSAVDVYFTGTPPTEVQQLVANPPAGVLVRVHRSRYDAATLTTALQKLETRYSRWSTIAGYQQPEGRGLTIEQTTDQSEHGPSLQQMSAVAGVPVTSTTITALPAGS